MLTFVTRRRRVLISTIPPPHSPSLRGRVLYTNLKVYFLVHNAGLCTLECYKDILPVSGIEALFFDRNLCTLCYAFDVADIRRII